MGKLGNNNFPVIYMGMVRITNLLLGCIQKVNLFIVSLATDLEMLSKLFGSRKT